MNIPKQYFYRERFMLKLCGISLTGNENIFYKIYSFILLFVFNYPYPFAAAGDLFKYNFNDTIDLAIYNLGTFVGVLEVTLVLKNRIRLGKLLNKLEQPPFAADNERGGRNVEEDYLRDCFSYTTLQSNIFYSVMILTVFPGTLYTLSKRLRSSDYHDWEFTYGPFTVLNVTYSPNFEISWFYQSFAVLNIGCNVISITLITSGLLAHISTQFKMLQNFLRRLVEHSYLKMRKDTKKCSNTEVDISKITWKYLQLSLKEAILYHMSIVEIATEAIDIFSWLMFSIYVIMLSILCFLVYDASVLDVRDTTTVLKILTGAACTFLQILLISYWGEQVATESEKLKSAAYETDFVGTDLRFQKALAFIVRRSQNTMRIKAGNFIDTSLVTFVWIIRTSYSSLMVMRKHNSN